MTDRENDEWVPIRCPENLDDMIETMASFTEEKVAWCLLCNQPIRTQADFVPNTHTHNCEAGRKLEKSIARATRERGDF